MVSSMQSSEAIPYLSARVLTVPALESSIRASLIFANVAENGIVLKYALSCSGLQYLGDHIFEFSTDDVLLNDGNPTKEIRINAEDLGITLKNSVHLPTVEDYDKFYTALHTGTLLITVSEYTAPAAQG